MYGILCLFFKQVLLVGLTGFPLSLCMLSEADIF